MEIKGSVAPVTGANRGIGRAMDFLLAALDEIASQIFGSVAHLFNLDLDIVFAGTTSTYWECEVVGELAGLAEEPADDQISKPAEAGARTFGHSKDHRGDLPQVVIAMAVTRDGIPVRCWTFPGDTSDQEIIRTVKDGLDGWNLRRLVWVADRGFASQADRAYLTRGGGHYIHAEKLRHTNAAAAALARPGRYHTVAGNLRVKEVGSMGACPGRRGAGRAVRDLPQPRGRRTGQGRPRPAGRPPRRAHRRLGRLAAGKRDRSKQFYQRLGWRFNSDVAPLDGLRIVQFTPPGSGASVTFGTGLTAAAPGSALAGLTVSDIEAAHHELAGRGIDATEVWHGPPFPRRHGNPAPTPSAPATGRSAPLTIPTAIRG